ncbi:hypothetical protein DI487_13750 [Flavobacterium sediminis]|uniref:DUF6705 domain-containing protein n=1 Tax=Flavobacterium sediminis TaxID=2201181 RepID=A0A2U8QY18_9FLAO|nr:DUF6705 family protein [Flavobacterium sediminis]AWM14806.1 hypothetical protein DI487_13750 [Flavobacterium sediminis]
MKTLLNILCLLLISINVNCQVTQILPLNGGEMSYGSYRKDLNNELPFWVGTWEGVSNGKKYVFEFTFFQQHLSQYDIDKYYYYDEIKGKFKVIDLNTNAILYNGLNATVYDDYTITNLVLRGNSLLLLFQDGEINCCNTAEFYLIKDSNSPDQIMYKDFSYGEYGCLSNNPCLYNDQLDIPMFLPTQDFVLTRQ